MTDAAINFLACLAAGVMTPAGWVVTGLIAFAAIVLIWNALTARRRASASARRDGDGDVVTLAPRKPGPKPTNDNGSRRRAA